MDETFERVQVQRKNAKSAKEKRAEDAEGIVAAGVHVRWLNEREGEKQIPCGNDNKGGD